VLVDADAILLSHFKNTLLAFVVVAGVLVQKYVKYPKLDGGLSTVPVVIFNPPGNAVKPLELLAPVLGDNQ
jgi:hypothetical protein